MAQAMPDFEIMADEDLMVYIEQEDLRCQAAKAAAEEARREDLEQIRHTHHQMVSLRFRHDFLQQQLLHPYLSPQRRTYVRNEIRRAKGDIESLRDYLNLYTDLMAVHDTRLQEEYSNLLAAMEELIDRGL